MTKTVEISVDLLKELFRVLNMDVPENISEESLLELVFKLKNKDVSAFETAENNFVTSTNNILVIDDIGVVTYQLKILLRNLGYNVSVAKDIFSGLNTFVKSNYSFIVMDLFVSTEQEGYTLLNETKKIITKNNLDTKIIVITASSKSENKVKCLNMGADYFIKKDVGWQDKLVELIESFQPSALGWFVKKFIQKTKFHYC